MNEFKEKIKPELPPILPEAVQIRVNFSELTPLEKSSIEDPFFSGVIRDRPELKVGNLAQFKCRTVAEIVMSTTNRCSPGFIQVIFGLPPTEEDLIAEAKERGRPTNVAKMDNPKVSYAKKLAAAQAIQAGKSQKKVCPTCGEVSPCWC